MYMLTIVMRVELYNLIGSLNFQLGRCANTRNVSRFSFPLRLIRERCWVRGQLGGLLCLHLHMCMLANRQPTSFRWLAKELIPFRFSMSMYYLNFVSLNQI